jgi:hypothetical protein
LPVTARAHPLTFVVTVGNTTRSTAVALKGLARLVHSAESNRSME